MLNPNLEGVTWYRIDFPEAEVLVSVTNKTGRVYTTPEAYKRLKGKRIVKIAKRYPVTEVQKA